MSELKYIKPEIISLEHHSYLNENWVKEKIKDDPSILGLGNLLLKDVERIQRGAGILDLYFQDLDDEDLRYEVEIQLGKTNESHIIRTIEYWDYENHKFPNYDHIAVIVAEDITSRFLNVINLFHGSIPLIALQMKAFKYNDYVSLVFTKVLDHRELASFYDDEIIDYEKVDREYWETKRGTKATCEIADELFKLVKEIDSNFVLKYNKSYIGLSRNGQIFNFVVFKPQKAALKFEIKLESSEDIDNKINQARIEVLEYSSRHNRYELRLTKEDIHDNSELIKDLLFQSYKEFSGEIPT